MSMQLEPVCARIFLHSIVCRKNNINDGGSAPQGPKAKAKTTTAATKPSMKKDNLKTATKKKPKLMPGRPTAVTVPVMFGLRRKGEINFEKFITLIIQAPSRLGRRRRVRWRLSAS